MNLPLSYFSEILSYDSETGYFTWKIKASHRLKPGDRAGSKKKTYISVKYKNKLFLCHRLAWLFHTGEWPKFDIDHINGNGSDNRICNLRDVPRSINIQNQRKAQKGNKSGLLGVRTHKGFWSSTIMIDGKRTHLGCFSNPEDAHQAYLKKKREFHKGSTI